MRKKILAMALSLPMILNGVSSANILIVSAADSTTPIVEQTTISTDVTETVQITEPPTSTTETTAVAETDPVETTVATTDIAEAGETATTTVTTTEDIEATTTTTWDKISNFPGEDGYLRFWMDDLEPDRKATITLTYLAEDSNKPISGAKVTVYKIANLTVHKGDAKYTLVDELKEDYPDLNFAGMSTEELDNLAAELAAKGLTAAGEAETGQDGKCKIENLEPGLYLINQTASIGAATDYENFKAFILNAPWPETKDDVYVGTWLYDVDALPKTELKGKKKLLIITPQTGDDTNTDYIKYAACIFGASVLGTIGVACLICKKKSKKEETD